ncbi:MAG: DNA internalization-related competence protein ComEC/Rec2 [Proteobacteria bacterium]|nr:DNA internalization-related competence protein ComEC/Rec2 [Pseudomonadota bacterium]
MMLISIAIGTLLGTVGLNCFSTLPQLQNIVVLITSILGLAVLFLFVSKQKLILLSSMLFAICVGFCWAFYCAQQKMWRLPQEDILKPITFCGTVTGVMRSFSNTLRFEVRLHRYQENTITQPIKVRLYVTDLLLKDSDQICGIAQLKPNWHLSNPGSFDQEKQLFSEGIVATGKLLHVHEIKKSNKISIHRLREKLIDRMDEIIGDKPYLGVIQATTLGIYHKVTPLQWQLFQTTGTVHAIAISGMHISFVALLCGGWITLLVKRFPKLTNRMPAKYYGAIFGLIGAWIYAALAGFSIPTQRALMMIVVAGIALFKGQPLLSWHALALAWLGIFIVDPLAILQIGFWLSFGCVGALIYGASHLPEKPAWRKWILPQWIVFIGLLPWCLLFFHQIPLLSPIANIIVLPVIDLLIIPACLLGLILSCISKSLAGMVWSIAEYALECVGWILSQLSNMPFNMWQQGDVPWMYLLFGFFASLGLLAPKGILGKQWLWLGFLPMLFYQGKRPLHAEFYFTLLDVGQGLAAVIQTRHHTLLYDAGPEFGKNNDAGRSVIIPFFLTQHIKRLDKVVISHGDLDHRGGLRSLDKWPIEDILSSETHRLSRSSRRCIGGEQWEWDGVTFLILNPLDEVKEHAYQHQEASAVYKKRNNISCVLKVTTGDQSVLLTGDIEKGAESLLLKRSKADLKSTVLVVPHHGSLTSSSEEFIKAVSPKYALFPVGMNNRYGFPKQTILARYQAMGVKNLIVSQTGALMFQLNKTNELTPPVRWRDTVRRYWHYSYYLEK